MHVYSGESPALFTRAYFQVTISDFSCWEKFFSPADREWEKFPCGCSLHLQARLLSLQEPWVDLISAENLKQHTQTMQLTILATAKGSLLRTAQMHNIIL